MAVKLTSNSQFFETVFGASDYVTKSVYQLSAAGVQFDISLFSCKAIYKGQVYQIALTQGSTALMKGVVEPVLVEQNKQVILSWIKNLMSVVNPVPAEEKKVSVVMTGLMSMTTNLLPLIKVIREITALNLGPAKQMAEAAKAGSVVVVLHNATVEAAVLVVAKLATVGAKAHVNDPQTGKAWTQEVPKKKYPPFAPMDPPASIEQPVVVTVAKKPVPQVIPLREAQALGQRVKGTSSNSVYYAVAMNARVRLAARIMTAGSISIRAEWVNPTPEELVKMEESGMSMKSDYASIHFNADNVPYGRCVGAFVAGLGIQWDQAVMSSQEMVVD